MMNRGTTPNVIAESAENIAPLPIGQAILVLLTCDEQAFTDAMGNRAFSVDYASHALMSVQKALKQAPAPSLSTIMPTIYEQAAKDTDEAASYRVGKILRWIMDTNATHLVSSIIKDLDQPHSKGRNRHLLGLTISLRLLLANFVTSGAIYAQKTKAAIKRAYLRSKNLQPSEMEFGDDLLIDQSPLAAFSEMGETTHHHVLMLFDLFDRLSSLAKAAMVPETDQLTVLSVEAFDTALLLITFVVKIVLANPGKSSIESDDTALSSIVERLLQPEFVQSTLSSFQQLLGVLSTGYRHLRPLYAFCLELTSNLLQRDSPFELPEAISSLYLTLDLTIPILIEDTSFLPAGTTLELTESVDKILSDTEPILSLLKENSAPRRRLIAATETLERLLLVLTLHLSKCGAKRLAQVIGKGRGDRIVAFIQSAVNMSIGSPYLIQVAVALLHHLPGTKLGASIGKLIQTAPMISSSFCSYHILIIILSHEETLDKSFAARIFSAPSEQRDWTLSLLHRAADYFLECKVHKKPLSYPRLEDLFRSVVTAVEKWDDAIVSRFPVVQICSALQNTFEVFKSFVSVRLGEHAKSGKGALPASILDLVVRLFGACPSANDAISLLLDFSFKNIQGSESGLGAVVSIVNKAVQQFTSAAAPLVDVLLETMSKYPTEPFYVRLASLLGRLLSTPEVSRIVSAASSADLAHMKIRLQQKQSTTDIPDVYRQLVPLLLLRILDPKCFSQAPEPLPETLTQLISECSFGEILQDQARKVAAELLARFPIDQWWEQFHSFWSQNTTGPVKEVSKVGVYVLCNKIMLHPDEIEKKIGSLWKILSPIFQREVTPSNDGLAILQRALIDFYALCITRIVSAIKESQVAISIASLRERSSGRVESFPDLARLFIDRLDLSRIATEAERTKTLQSESDVQQRILMLNCLISASKLIAEQKITSSDGKPGVEIFGRILLPIMFEILQHDANYAMRGAYLQLVFSLSFHMKQSVLPYAIELRKICLMSLRDSGNSSTRLAGLKLVGSTFATVPEIWEQDTAAFSEIRSLLVVLAAKDPLPQCKELALQLVEAITITK